MIWTQNAMKAVADYASQRAMASGKVSKLVSEILMFQEDIEDEARAQGRKEIYDYDVHNYMMEHKYTKNAAARKDVRKKDNS